MNRSKLHKTTVATKASTEWKRKEETDKLTEGEEGGGGQKETHREGDGRECVREREIGETD